MNSLDHIVFKKKPSQKISVSIDPKHQYEEWVVRFCYSAAKLPPNTVEHILDLMETCGDNADIGLSHNEGTA